MIVGHLLNERYRIKRRIGGGGMANVYLGFDLILERDVAIKVLRMEFVNDPEFVERFDREAQAATSLSHPNIVNIYDVGEEDDILYIVMEYVDGLTLKEYIQKHGPLSVEKAIDIMDQLTAAIQHAHETGLIHRDIKPQNVLINQNGTVKVTDFGIAVALSATALTQTNSVLGSVHYLSPEQARGGKATKKSDIYSLGIVFYELLTGELPFSGQSPVSIALKHLQDDIPSVRAKDESIPQSVENIILKATTKDPFHRYQSVSEMGHYISVALEPSNLNEPIYEPPYETGEETKAIPIITDESMPKLNETDTPTLVHEVEEASENKQIGQEQKSPPTKKKRKRRRWIISIASILVIALIFFTFLLFSSPKDVVVPDVTDLEYEEAVEQLEALKLKVNKETIPSEEVEEGKVVKSDPEAGRTVKEKSTVDVYVSEGREKVEFEDYVGKNFAQVERILEEDGYEEIRSYDVISDDPVGQIVTQIQPLPGEEVIPEETTVIFEVSSGPKKVSLGNLVGLSLDQARDYAKRNSLKLEIKEAYSDSVEKNHVISQNPRANSELEEGSTVTVTISKGPEEKPPRTHSVTFTVPFEPTTGPDGELQKEQLVQIYVGDMNENISNVFHEAKINRDKEYELTLVIAENEVAEYRVLRDGVEIIRERIPY
ncbi:MAG TPA: Stk1 family PASTA domain-containing Ser/Thr kinase [Pseudogracilibacillus sp.]|nr:Stk1 family PASTA domain-containing Ser/Thr kinase [Pseudogracilibacillus sp.]